MRQRGAPGWWEVNRERRKTERRVCGRRFRQRACALAAVAVVVVVVGFTGCRGVEKAPVRQVLTIDPEGFRFVDSRTGSARPLTFESPADRVLLSVEHALGSGPAETGFVGDCALDYATWSSGLTVWSDSGRFVGWGLRDDAQALSTMSGIGIGSTRAELESRYAAEIATTSLGVEFTAGAMAGLLDSRSPGARITHLWAGQVCIAR